MNIETGRLFLREIGKKMKRTISAILIIAMSVGLLLSLSACGANTPSNEMLSPLVADAILFDNASGYYDSECSGEGHKILGCSVSGNKLKVYALTMYGNYGFQNDMFIKVSGSGVIPAVLTFEKDGEEYKLLEIEYPRDGAEYTKSIKRMFPLKYRAEALHHDNAHDELKSQEQSYAEAYLESIGREAEIGEYGDLNAMLLTDVGVSVDVSNQLCCDKNLGDYPYWIGTEEYLKNGIRYVRTTSYDEEAGQIIYHTHEKDTGEVIECFVFDAATGDSLSAGAVVSQMMTAGIPETIDSNKAEDHSDKASEDICDSEAFELFSNLRDSFIAVSLELDGTEIYRQTDCDAISLVADLMENADKLDWEPKTYNINGDFLLVFETESGTHCSVQLDLVEDLYRTTDGFYDYGEPDTQAVKELWTLLGIKQWPDAVYEKYDWFFDGNGIEYKK